MALVAAADQDLSAASAARSQDVCIEQTHLVASGQHAASLLSRPGAHVQCAPQTPRATVHAGQQHDGALPVFHRLRLHHARVVHRIGQHIARRLGAHEHLAAVGLEQATIAQQGIGHALVHAHAQQLIPQQLQCHGLTSRHGHAAARGHHGTQVVHMGPQQGHVTAIGCAQQSLVDDRAHTFAGETVASRHEIGVVQLQG